MLKSDTDKPCWLPDPERAARSRMRSFMRFASERQGRAFDDYADLHSWSVDEPAEFWQSLAAFTGTVFSREADSVFEQSGDMRSARWFEGAALNFAENLLVDADDTPAILFSDESGRRQEWSRRELRDRVADLAAGMRGAGIGQGDRVAAVLPNCPEVVIAMLAASSVGAIFSSCSPDFGAEAIIDRLGQISPRLLILCDGYLYAGKRIDCSDKFEQVQEALTSVEQIVLVPFLPGGTVDKNSFHATVFADFCISNSLPEYTQLPFDHPLCVLYSSGTTGRPKCIVHGAGGTLLQHKKELMLHTDLQAGDRIFYFTTCGWMMWNWLVSALAVKAIIVLYDGSPFHPDPGVLLRMAEQEKLNVFGTSPRYLSALEKTAGAEAITGLPELRTLLSTGAPLAPENYVFAQELLGAHVQVCSISGGTDLISCFALGNPLLPVYPGELQCCGLGMAVEVFDPQGSPVRKEIGELVCTKAFPSMPREFWNDPDGSKYAAAYFDKFPGVWTHGDLAEKTSHDGLIIRGRSDAVLNPGGVRIGSAEICEPVMQLAEVSDCIAVAQRWQNDVRIVLFVVTNKHALDELLRERIRVIVRASASPRHVPEVILEVPEIPRTVSGKAVELAVRAVIHGEPVDNIGAIANPAALEAFRGRPELG